MFFRILKRDLKRKAAANTIVLLFIILATTFVSGSINSIIAISGGADFFIENGGVADYTILCVKTQDTTEDVENLRAISGVTDVRAVPIVMIDGPSIHRTGEERKFSTMLGAVAADNSDAVLFDTDGNKITEVEPGTILISSKNINGDDFQIGDTVEIDFDGFTKSFRIGGIVMDALFSSSSVSVSRIVMNPDEFREIYDKQEENASIYNGAVFCVTSDDVSKLEQESATTGIRIFALSGGSISTLYILDMIPSGIFMIVSVCLILISCIILKFIISTTVAEEFREIGAMKAVGIGNTRIRMLYAVKYFAIACIGAFVGFFTGIPFGNAIIDSSSKTLLLDSGYPIAVGLISSLVIVILVTFFCFTYTRRIKRLSPANAVSDIGTENFGTVKKRLHLKNHIAHSGSFLAANDIVTHPRKFATVAVTYSVCILLVMILTVLNYSLSSKSFIQYVGIHEFDLVVTLNQSVCEENGIITDSTDHKELLEARFDIINSELDRLGFSGKTIAEINFSAKLINGEYSAFSTSYIGVNTDTEEYHYTSGTAPALPNEIAVATVIADKLHVGIGDTVTVESSPVSGDFIITALYQTTMNLGEGVRFNENLSVDYESTMGCLCLVCFDDNPDIDELNRRADMLKESVYTKNVFTYSEYINSTTGLIDTISSIKNAVTLIACTIIALITVLMERSFAVGERSEIALLKALGFKSATVYTHHVLRFLFVCLISIVLAVVLVMPVTKLALDPIFATFGATAGVEYGFNAVELFITCPMIVLGVTVISAFLTSLFTKSVKASDTSSI